VGSRKLRKRIERVNEKKGEDEWMCKLKKIISIVIIILPILIPMD
jgi:hypothetical protein